MAKAPRLSDVDLDRMLTDETDYLKQLSRLQYKMLEIQQTYRRERRRAVLVFEGWDASGKGGAIQRVTEPLDPRGVRVWPIGAPRPDEQGKHFLYRFWRRLPEPGTLAIFDRSWYGRVLVERVDRLTAKADWQRGYGEINEFERLLVDDGVRLVKLFLHISPKAQLKRFAERLNTPHKRWKIGLPDIENHAKRSIYVRAIDDMFARTHTRYSPWHVISGEHKWHSRVTALGIITTALSRGIDLAPPSLDPALIEAARGIGVKIKNGA
jgi:polyphosphate kinase 2 (PPK2 family)